MTIAIFGLTVTSSWGTGHAVYWRALCESLAKQGHLVIFFERDQPCHRAHRDVEDLPDHVLHIYPDWATIRDEARAVVRAADASIVTSDCADLQNASTLILEKARGIKAFYEMNASVTEARTGPLAAFDVVIPASSRTSTADELALELDSALHDAGADRAISQSANGFAGSI
jgi:hypothetical protein